MHHELLIIAIHIVSCGTILSKVTICMNYVYKASLLTLYMQWHFVSYTPEVTN